VVTTARGPCGAQTRQTQAPKSAREAVPSCEFVRDSARKAWERERGGESVGEGAGEMLKDQERELESARACDAGPSSEFFQHGSGSVC